MKDLLIFELKKIIRNKVNLIVILGSLAITFMLYTFFIVQFKSYDSNGNQVPALSGIKLEKQSQEKIKGVLTEDRITKDIKEFQDLYNNPENLVTVNEKKELSNSTYNKFITPKADYLRLIDSNYQSPNYSDYSISAIRYLPIENGSNFYHQRSNKVSQILNSNYKDWNYSEEEKEFWLKKNNEVSQPYEYGYHSGWKNLYRCIELMLIPIIAICICVAPVFAGEYQSGADNIILSSRYGKSKLIVAKILASFIFSLVVFTVSMITGLGVIFFSFGIDGWNLPIQLINTTAPYSLTFLQATSLCILTLYIVMLAMVSITLLLSAKMNTAFSVLVVMICIIMGPLFFKYSETNGVWNHIYMVLPYMSCQPVFGSDTISYFSYPLPLVTIDILTMRILLYSIISIICVPFSYRIFKKHQVG